MGMGMGRNENQIPIESILAALLHCAVAMWPTITKHHTVQQTVYPSYCVFKVGAVYSVQFVHDVYMNDYRAVV